MHGIVLQHVGQIIRFEQVIDTDDFDVGKILDAARNTMRPIRPNPLIPTLIAMLSSNSVVSETCGYGKKSGCGHPPGITL
jgi:hypothetical protein